MTLQAYRRVLDLPRVRATILLMFLARLPMTAMGILVTLHVVIDLGRGYGEAGLAGAVTTLASALGAPTVGRMLDRYGLRRVVAVCGACSAAFWISLPHLPYLALLTLAAPASMLAVPAQSLARQFLTALVPKEQRRTVFSLDMVLAEVSLIVGPALGILVMTQVSSTAALTGIGVWLGLTALTLCLTNLHTRTGKEAGDDGTAVRPPMRSWFGGRLLGSLIISMGSMFALIGTEIAVIATMRAHGQTSWTGLVIAAMSVASIAGGLVHGAVRRSLPQAVLATLLGALLVPVGLFGHPWWVLAIVLIPMNLMCTPALAAGTETVSNLAPSRVRGEAVGLLTTASGFGMALGNPVVGFAIDHSSAGWGSRPPVWAVWCLSEPAWWSPARWGALAGMARRSLKPKFRCDPGAFTGKGGLSNVDMVVIKASHGGGVAVIEDNRLLFSVQVEKLSQAVSGNVALLELKTPMTRLLGAEYRAGVYSPSGELAGAVAQVQAQRDSLIKFSERRLLEGRSNPLTPFNPACIVVAGCTDELDTHHKKRSFELYRSGLLGVTVLCYDELFRNVQGVIDAVRGD